MTKIAGREDVQFVLFKVLNSFVGKKYEVQLYSLKNSLWILKIK